MFQPLWHGKITQKETHFQKKVHTSPKIHTKFKIHTIYSIYLQAYRLYTLKLTRDCTQGKRTVFQRILSILFATTIHGISDLYSLSSLYHFARFLYVVFLVISNAWEECK